MIVAALLFVLGLVLLIKGGDWFVEGASGLAERFKMPQVLIGATVVSIGTTLPEVMVSAQGALGGHGEIAYGNAIGSIICNTALIAAITIIAVPALVERSGFIMPIFFFFESAVFYSIIAYVQGYFSRVTGVILLLTFVVYMVFTVRQAISNKSNKAEDSSKTEEIVADDATDDKPKGKIALFAESLFGEIVFLVVGAVFIAVGANLLVDNGIIMAEYFGVPESVIALTFVALGTSLPELVTAITSLVKGYGALSLGNVIGANLFNLILVNGTACTLSPFAVPNGKLIAGIPSSLVIDIPVMLFVMSFLAIPALIKGRLYRIQGIILLAVYVGFISLQFIL